MNSFRDLPIRKKLIVLMIVSTGSVMLIAMSAFIFFESIMLRQSLEAELSSVARTIGANSTAAITFDDSRTANENLNALREDTRVMQAAIVLPDGKVLGSYSHTGAVTDVQHPRHTEGDGRCLHLRQPVDMDGKTVGYVLIEASLEQLNNRIILHVAVGFFLFLLTLAASGLLALRLQQVIADPLLKLESVAREISEQGGYHLRVEKTQNDEIGRLTDCFNDMLSQIETRDKVLAGRKETLEREVELRTSELAAAKERAEAAARAKSSFLATVSHEIRTPLNGLLGMADQLMDLGLNSAQKECAEIIVSCGNLLLSLINDILDFSKLEAGKAQFEIRPFEVVRCVEESLDVVASRAREKHLPLTHEIDLKVPFMVQGDETRIRQVLVNLLGNAVKFTSSGFVNLSVTPSVDDGFLRFTVRDSGIGIPPEMQDKLFAPFLQADVSTTRRFGGTGLGLAICKQIVESMKGQIQLESLPGIGSSFHVEIPLQPSVAAPPAWWHAGLLSGCSIAILLKEATIAAMILPWLRHWGCSCEVVPVSDAASLLGEIPSTGRILIVDSDFHGMARFPHHPSLIWCGHRVLGSLATILLPPKLRNLFDRIAEIVRPELASSQASVPEKPVARRDIAPVRVVVVDDNKVNLRVAEGLVRKLGCDPVTVSSGKAALQVLASSSIPLVLMDMRMPELDGVETTRIIRANPEQYGSPFVIALTANSQKEDYDACIEAGMNDFLHKPISLDALAKALLAYQESASSNTVSSR